MIEFRTVPEVHARDGLSTLSVVDLICGKCLQAMDGGG